jgi:uncharacterized SAM-binding protein YcdF (DUF218 family)
LAFVRRVLAVLFVVLLVLGTAATLTYLTVPSRAAHAAHVDALVVLGAPVEDDGKPSPTEHARVLGAVAEYKAGRAPHVIFSGGAAHNQYVEAETMARLAIRQGVPVAAIEIEDQSKTTVQNIYFSNLIMQSHGWSTAEVVSDPAHLPRTVLILEHDRLDWQTHASAWPPEFHVLEIGLRYVYEVIDVARFRWFGVPREEAAPVLSPARS